MPTWSSADAFAAEVARFQADLEREVRRSAGVDMAKRAQQIAERAASSDLGGDPKFSGWKPALTTEVKPLSDGALLKPTRSSAGPWTVAEFGRNSDGGVGLFQGPGVNLKSGRTTRGRDGSLRVSGRRGRKGKRWNGVTRGKGTASTAYGEMERELPSIAEKHVKQALSRRFDVR
jgi:hypothetical protein